MSMVIVGAGHLGRFLHREFKDAELADEDAMGIKTLGRPDIVVNTVGKTDLAWCEEHPLEAFASNAHVPLHLYSLVSKLPRCLFVHISSGCIWKGPYDEYGEPFEPDSLPSPACFYALTKVAGEAMLHQYVRSAPIVILRPRQLYSDMDSPRNTLNKLCSYERLLTAPNSMTSAYTLARMIQRLRFVPEDPIERQHNVAVFNVYDRGAVSPLRVGMLLHAAGCRDRPEMLSRAELDTFLWPERVDVVMHDAMFEEICEPPTAEEELKRVIDLWKRNRP